VSQLLEKRERSLSFLVEKTFQSKIQKPNQQFVVLFLFILKNEKKGNCKFLTLFFFVLGLCLFAGTC
jgi:hypothetical protein